jgi:large subunit ribosomal protein L10
MREHDVKFKITKNSLTKLALANTNIKSITDLFTGPTAVAYSSDPVAPAKVSVEYRKKFKNFKIIGGAFEGEKIGEEKIVFLASLPTLDEVRSKLARLINLPAQKIASVLGAPAGQLARLVFSQSKGIENSAQVLGKENING